MTKYEFKVVPAPSCARRLSREERGQDPIATTMVEAMNELGLQGWDYVRTETLKMSARGLFGTRAMSSNVMVFRRPVVNFREVKDEIAEEKAKVSARRVARPKMIENVRTGARRITVIEADEKASAAAPA